MAKKPVEPSVPDWLIPDLPDTIYRRSGANGAHYSPCEKYRYQLWRSWGRAKPLVFIGLNPSTATETQNDPTVRRCCGFAKRDGHGGIVMLNLFAYRSTDPDNLARVADPIGYWNDEVLDYWLRQCPAIKVVACWGQEKISYQRGRDFLNRVITCDASEQYPPFLTCSALHSFGVTKNGSPKHPLYLANATPILKLQPLLRVQMPK